MASAKKNSNERGTSTRRTAAASPSFVVCVDNDGYEASLERNKIYLALRDRQAKLDGDVRVIDESGEDYLYPADRFVAVELPTGVKASVRRGSAA